MTVRSDGTLGFPGGIVEDGESVEQGLNRECLEEINAGRDATSVEDGDFLCCHLKSGHPEFGDVELHFYAKEISVEAFKAIEADAGQAVHFGTEIYGLTRVPLHTRPYGLKGLPRFLCNVFAGNARSQLLYGLQSAGLLNQREVQKALADADEFAKETLRKP